MQQLRRMKEKSCSPEQKQLMLKELHFPAQYRKLRVEVCQWKFKQMSLSEEDAEGGLSAGHGSVMNAQEASCGSEGALNICVLHPRLGLDLPVVPSACEYSRDPIVTKSQVAPFSLLVLIYCLKVLFCFVLAGAMDVMLPPSTHGKMQKQLSPSTLTVTITASGVTPS